jgi:serralysin
MAIVNGDDGPNTLRGTAGNDTINGFGGDDTIYGNGGVDEIDAGDGDDVIHLFNPGNDLGGVMGGDGYDAIFFNTSEFVNLGNPSQSLEKIVAGHGGDNISLFDALYDLKIFGRGGDDRIHTGFGNDGLIGGDGDDSMRAGEGDDFLNGGEGIDILIGEQGRDAMIGGDGADRFVFTQPSHFAGMTTVTCDRIIDFDQAEGDRILLANIDADTTNGFNTNDTFTFIGAAAFSGAAGELRYEYIWGHTYVMGDWNGDAGADFWIRLDGIHALTAGDFLL